LVDLLFTKETVPSTYNFSKYIEIRFLNHVYGSRLDLLWGRSRWMILFSQSLGCDTYDPTYNNQDKYKNKQQTKHNLTVLAKNKLPITVSRMLP